MRINHQTNTVDALNTSTPASGQTPTLDNHLTTRGFVLDNIDYGEIYINESGRVTATSVALSGGATAPTSSGSLSDTFTINGTYLNIEEGSGVPGFDARFTFTNLDSSPNKINILGRYNGTVAHEVEVQLWNWVHTRWDDVLATTKDIPHSTGDDALYTFTVTEELSAASDYLGTGGDAGKTIVRIDHAAGGTNTDVLRIDYMDIVVETISLVDAGSYYKLTSGITSGHSRVSTTSELSGAIVFGHNGKYFVTTSTSFLGTGLAVIEGAVYVNGVRKPNIRFTRRMSAGGDVGAASCQGFVDVSIGDVMQFKFSSNTSNAYISVEHFNMTCNYRGA